MAAMQTDAFKIGVFDSGVGGLTVARALEKRMPATRLVYLGDTARTPYGSKSPQTIVDYSLRCADFLVQRGATALVIACNTASSHAADHVARHTGLPVFEVIGPGARQAVAVSRKQRIGVIATRATVQSDAYRRCILELSPQAKVWQQACPLLVPLVEEGWLDRPETRRIVRYYLRPLKMKQIDTLVLGCTHYPLLAPLIQRKAGRSVRVVDSAQAVADHVARQVGIDAVRMNNTGKGADLELFLTDPAPGFLTTAKRILKRNVQAAHVDI